MNELSIFIDESGDFGEYDYRSPYYLISMVFHDQEKDISNDLISLDERFRYMGLENFCVHAGPIIRMENEHKYNDIETRKKILKMMMAFIRHLDIKAHTVFIEKKHIGDEVEAVGKLSKELSRFVRDNLEFFYSFDVIKVYYDNGQVQVSKIISSVFNSLLDNVEFRKVMPADYRLFQVADVICTVKYLELKMKDKNLSKQELTFFSNERTLTKNYIKPVREKEF